MGLLQRWLEESDRSIARFTTAFYVLTFAFMAIFGLQLVVFLWFGNGPVERGEVAQLVVSLFLTLTMYSLALDGRRSYKAMKERGEAVRVR